MSEDDAVEYDLLKHANERGKFAIDITIRSPAIQAALERMMARRWIVFLDKCPLEVYPDKIFYVYLATPIAMTWFRSQRGREGIS